MFLGIDSKSLKLQQMTIKMSRTIAYYTTMSHGDTKKSRCFTMVVMAHFHNGVVDNKYIFISVDKKKLNFINNNRPFLIFLAAAGNRHLVFYHLK